MPAAPSKSRYLSAETNAYIAAIGKNGTSQQQQQRGQTNPPPPIDLARYTELSGTHGLKLKQAYTALVYAAQRHEDLTLLAEYGRNMWLMGNDALEQELKAVELAVEQARREVETVNAARRAQQADVSTTVEYLNKRWRDGIRSVVEVGVACAELEQQKRALASDGQLA